MKTDIASLLDPVLAIAREAGQAIMQIYSSEFAVEYKADESPLTAADRAAHQIIRDRLGALSPRLPVWSEEASDIDFAERSGWPMFWLVDPLDGTKEFIKRNGEFTVNIALVQGHEPVLGVVLAPARDEAYVAARGAGAFLDRPATGRRSIRVRRPAASPVRVVGSRSHRGSSLDALLAALGDHVLVPMGSSLKICLIAAGEADFYPRLGPTSEWDTAAAQAVVQEAGGRVVDLGGKPLRYNAQAGVLNPHFLVFGDPTRDWLAIARSAAR